MPGLIRIGRYRRYDDETMVQPQPVAFFLVGGLLAALAGYLLVRSGPLAALLAVGGTCALALVARPFLALCGVVALVSLEALNTIEPSEVYSFTGVKVLGLILVLSLLPEAASQRIRLRLDTSLLVLGFFFLGILVSFLTAANTGAAISGALTFAQLAILWMAVQQLVISRERLRTLAKVSVWTLLVSAVCGIYQYVTNPEARISGTSQNAAILSADLCVAMGFAYALWATRRDKTTQGIWAFVLGLIAVGILVSLSRAAYIAFFPAVLVASLYMGKGGRGVLSMLIVALALFFLAPFAIERLAETSLESDMSTRGHLYSLKAGVRMMADNPWLGVGIGNYPERYLQYTNDERGRPRSAHNSYLAIGAEMGVLALMAFVALHFLAYRTLWRRSRAQLRVGDRPGAAWSGAIAFCLTTFCLIGLLHSLEISKYLWILLALALRPPDESWEEESP